MSINLFNKNNRKNLGLTRLVKMIYQRAKYGVSNWDLWDLDTYVIELMPEVMHRFIEGDVGYPCDDEFPTYDSYIKHLQNIEADFTCAREHLETSRNTEDWQEEEKEYKQALECWKQGIAKFIDILPTLWW